MQRPLYYSPISPSPPRRHIGLIRKPGGRVIGEVVGEDGRRIFVRRVTAERHLYRHRDAWTLGVHALQQAQRLRVDILCYVACEGTYTVSLAAFVNLGERLRSPHTEDHVALPRSWWTFTPATHRGGEQLKLEIGP